MLKPNKWEKELLDKWCFHVACLYNVGLYAVRQHYFDTGEFKRYNAFYHECKDNYNYKMIPTDIGQQILKLVDQDFRSFIGLLKLKKKGNYKEKVRIPGYKKKGSAFILVISGTRIDTKEGFARIPMSQLWVKTYGKEKTVKLPLPKFLVGEKIKQITVRPMNGKYEVGYTYEKKGIENDLNNDKILSIDLGIDNFATCFSKAIEIPFIINGREIKSKNQWYNKIKSKIQSAHDLQNIKGSKKLSTITLNRKNWIQNFFNQAVNRIVKECIKHKIGVIVVGDFAGSKQGINIGKVNNQKFVSIPYHTFKAKLKSKCEENGIAYHEQEESYTSKCSSIDNEEIKKHEKYKGRRVKRGLFKSADGTLINADVNGAINIGRKFKSKLKSKDDSVVRGVNPPIRLRLCDLIQAA